MQKVLKNVIKLFFIQLIILSNCYSQNNYDDYLLLNEVIEMHNNPKDTVFLLQNKGKFIKGEVKNLYKYFVLNEKNIVTLNGGKMYDNRKIEADPNNQEEQDEFQRKWFSIYNTIDTILTNKEIYKLSNSVDSICWDIKWLHKKVIIIDLNVQIKEAEKEDNKGINYFNSHYISKPFYSLDKKYAIVQYRKYGRIPSCLYVFKKQKNVWVRIATIKEHF